MASTYISIPSALSAVGSHCLILLSITPRQLALVDQYEAMLGVHGLHHLTVQEGALQLRQAQAV